MASRKGNRVFLWVLMGLLAIGLVGFGTGGVGGRTTSLGSVDGKDIPVQAYANALGNQLRDFEEQLGQPVPFDQAQVLGLDSAALARLVAVRALDAEVERLGLSVDDARVAEAVRAVPAFQGVDGSFDRALYADQLDRNGLDEESFETSLREDAARRLLEAAVQGGVPDATAFADALARYNGERRVVTWATLPAATVETDLPAPTAAELRAHYDANPDAFTAPEVREVAYAWLSPEAVGTAMEIADADLRALYDERRGEYVQEERRLVERLVYPAEADAAVARARLDGGEATFEALVEARGLQLSDIDLGDVARGELGAAGEPVFAAEVGEVVGPVPTDLGPALFRVNAALAADEVTYEEAAPDLRAELAAERARAVIDDALPPIEDLIAGGATIADLAGQTDLEPGTIAWSEGRTDGIAGYEAFRSAAAAAEPGDLPEVVRLEDGGLVALTVEGVTPPALRPYDEVADEVAAALWAERLREAVTAAAEARAEAIADGASFEDQGLTPATTPALTRREVVEGTPPDFVATAFTLDEGAATALSAGVDAIVLRVDSVAPPPADDPGVAAEREAVAAQVGQSIAQDLFAAFAAQVQANAEIRIDDAAVAAVNAQFQ